MRRSAGGKSMLAAAMVAVEMHVAAMEAVILAIGPDDVVSNHHWFADYCRRRPIAGDPATIGCVVAVNPGVAGSGARGARDHDGRGGAESDSNADVRRGEKPASQKHHHCDRLFHFLALLAP